MKTVSTKLTKEDFEKFQEMCNHDGQCMSEQLRDLIKMGLDAYDDGLEMEQKDNSNVLVEGVSKEPTPMIHGTIFDDDGNIISTF